MGGFGQKVRLADGSTNTHFRHHRWQAKTVRHAAGFGCTESIKRVDQIDPAVWRWVVDLISNDERLEQLIGEIAAESAEKDRTG